ncbi:hypothetical protein SAMN03159463_03143 [Mesorhizobium sp. NFR06]|uniref:hypothetical protein n=1 Tax=Mesorhizobium sp. NFR06 TaxID=1566290 RepID=UPI0008DF7A52|nr:hypothetical protein [Mesorhizobium sp. NFR06]SFO87645.1 hypothetical protein SAMN03159463_03143 [Mesorhizobium sp. NFR06]
MYTLTARIFAMAIGATIGAQIGPAGVERSKKSGESTKKQGKNSHFLVRRASLLHYGNNGAQTFRLRQN